MKKTYLVASLILFSLVLLSSSSVFKAQTNPAPPNLALLDASPTASPERSPTIEPSPAFPGTTPTTKPSATAVSINPSKANELDELVSQKRSVETSSELLEAVLTPFVNEAQKRRQERARVESDYHKRVDRRLNEGRVNFLLYGYGETHEPPAMEKAIIGSYTIISYDTRTTQVDIISMTHDIRAPSIEDLLPEKRGVYRRRAAKIDQAYPLGGFRLTRRVMENATGLSMDFQFAFKDTVIREVIDEVFQGVEVDVPAPFDVHAFYLDGKKYPAGHFAQGGQILNGTQVIQFIKTVPVSQGYYGKPLEHNSRKHLIFQSLLEAMRKNASERVFWLRGTAFLSGELVKKDIVYDFDPVQLMIANMNNVIPAVGKYVSNRKRGGFALPKINRTRYVADPANGDGGVQWVGANAGVNPVTAQDIREGIYPTLDMTIPLNANPYGDLVSEYWPSVRKLVRDSLEEVK